MSGRLTFFLRRIVRRLRTYRLGLMVAEVARSVFVSVTQMNSLDKRFISLKPSGSVRGNVLLCYINEGFFLKPGQRIPNGHTNCWEAVQIAETFLNLGYQVDVISENNEWFVPVKQYSFFVGNRINFERIAATLNPDCIKILHIDTAHWLFHNTAEHERLLALQRRKGVTLPTQRALKPNLAIEHADFATILGNQFTIRTYAYAHKPLYPLGIASAALLPWAEDKDFDRCRNQFLWLGSIGFVHKGLDLVLEAFAKMPNCHLTVCAPIDTEKEFKTAYENELYRTSNIHTVGWIDVESLKFMEIARRCVALIYPSCSEGQSGGVVTCMQAGLIPIVSCQSGVDVDGFGVTLKTCSVEEIKDSVQMIAGLPAGQLEHRSRKAWEYARANHTRQRFAETYRAAISRIISDRQKATHSAKEVIGDTALARV